MAKIPDLQVVLPYKTLLELLDAASSVTELKKQIEIRDKQIDALRRQFIELMDVVQDLREEIKRLD